LFNDHHKPGHQPSKELTTQAVLIGLKNGYDVILEGILNTKTTLPRLEKFFAIHPNENYFFYLDVGFGETIRRHQTRHEKAEFGEDSMKKWWDYATPLGHENEVIIPDDSSLEETVRTISSVAGLDLKKDT
jgi:hypothetical protein